MSNLSGLFDDVNTQVGNIAQQVGTKPSNFEPRVFAMIEALSRNVVLPIAGVILTFIACYELIEMITQHNNMAQFEPALLMKWIFKKVCPHCQKEFVPTSNRQIFCSKDCCYQARQDKTKADREAEKGNHYYRQRVCAVCGSTYWPAHSQQKFCSEECQKQNHNEKSLEFYHKKRKEKSECNDLLQTREPVSSTNSSEIITIPA